MQNKSIRVLAANNDHNPLTSLILAKAFLD